MADLNWFARLVRTDAGLLVVPTRIFIGLVLIFSYGGGLDSFLSVCRLPVGSSAGADIDPCHILRVVEIAIALSFAAGLFVRLTAVPLALDFVVRFASNIVAYLPMAWRDAFRALEPRGDWLIAALDVGAIVLLYDLFRVGEGAFSIDWCVSRLVSRTKTKESAQ